MAKNKNKIDEQFGLREKTWSKMNFDLPSTLCQQGEVPVAVMEVESKYGTPFGQKPLTSNVSDGSQTNPLSAKWHMASPQLSTQESVWWQWKEVSTTLAVRSTA